VLPTVEEDVDVGGLTLKLDRTKWGYSAFAGPDNGTLARFVGEDIEITLRRIAPLPDEGRLLVEFLAAQKDVLYVRAVATSGALRWVKAAYGIRHSRVSGRSWLCFEARPTGKAPQWQDANDLVPGA
jgi:hypothetical protein